jgi:hypothetical protein
LLSLVQNHPQPNENPRKKALRITVADAIGCSIRLALTVAFQVQPG